MQTFLEFIEQNNRGNLMQLHSFKRKSFQLFLTILGTEHKFQGNFLISIASNFVMELISLGAIEI